MAPSSANWSDSSSQLNILCVCVCVCSPGGPSLTRLNTNSERLCHTLCSGHCCCPPTTGSKTHPALQNTTHLKAWLSNRPIPQLSAPTHATHTHTHTQHTHKTTEPHTTHTHHTHTEPHTPEPHTTHTHTHNTHTQPHIQRDTDTTTPILV